MNKRFKIGNREVGEGCPALLIAEIGSNFDQDLDRAYRLTDLAMESGADVVKFQTFLAEALVNPRAFGAMKDGYQASWDKDVFSVYQDAVFPREWHEKLARYCEQAGTIFMTSAYDFAGVDLVADLGAPALKIGSGDLTWHQMLRYQASKGLPLLLACGAATMAETTEAVQVLEEAGCQDLVLLQCVTNYPASFDHINLRAMANLGRTMGVPYGYSDHTPGSTVPLGAVALGGCVIEKHFTDDKTRKGPDHPFAMDPADFKAMSQSVRDLEKALGDGIKRVTPEERETRIIMRRSLFAARDLKAGQRITADDIVALRPQHGILPDHLEAVVGRTLIKDVEALAPLTWEHF
ncbi:MAG: N-acetylneuraminate synthase family protein [Desulfarculaceae bacterium]|jgi:sialic acid synthase SpsE